MIVKIKVKNVVWELCYSKLIEKVRMVWENKNKYLFYNNVNIILLNGIFKYDEDGKFYIIFFIIIKKKFNISFVRKIFKRFFVIFFKIVIFCLFMVKYVYYYFFYY